MPSDTDLRPNTAELTLLHSEPGSVTTYALHNVLITVWNVVPTAPAVQHVSRGVELLAQRHPGGLSMVHLVKVRLNIPDEAARNAMVRTMKSRSVTSVGMVVEASGFVMGMLRSVVTSIRLLSEGRFEYRIFGSIDELSEWLPDEHRARTGVTLDKERLRRALQQSDQAALVSRPG